MMRRIRSNSKMIKKFNFSDIILQDNKKEKENTKVIINEIKEESCGCCCEQDTSSLSSPSPSSSIKFTIEKSNLEKRREENQNNGAKILIIIGLALTIPLVIIELLQYYDILKGGVFIDYFLLSLATPVQILLGGPFYKRFYNSVKKKRSFTVDTLVVISTSVAYAYSIIAIFTNQDARFFEASASVLTIFTIGEYVESKVLKTTSESIKRLVSLKPKTATIITSDGNQKTIDIDDLAIDNVFIVKPGDNFATDGFVVYGESSIDESMITGESIPVYKKIGDKVIGGTTNKNGYLHIRATSVGSQTVLANIVEMVRKARENKPSIQRIADKCAKYFIPLVLSIAISSSLYWLIVAQSPIEFGITVFATVLIVSCPCALGIATPMIISLGIGKVAKQGILIKGGKYLEKLSSIDTIVFDKTGTLTKGKPEVADIIPNDVNDEFYLLQLASSSEIKSEHPIAQAIVKKAHEKNITTLPVSEFNSITGQGIVAKYQQKRIFVGNPRTTTNNIATINNNNNYFLQSTIIPKKLESKIFELELEGKTVVAVFIEDKMIGLIAVSDIIRENAVDIVKQLELMEKEIILLSGDNERTANAIAKKLGIKNVFSQVLPQGKVEKIKDLQNEKRSVAMVGDGINDAPALTQADIGIAMSSGTDVAMNAGHVILMKNDLSDIVFAFKLAKYSMKKIKQNLTISFTYNSIAISIAAGLLYSVTNSLILTPALAALGWIISDSLVFGNSLFVKKFKLNLNRELTW
ncbi:MAG: copper-translocating P-type ATPase [Candidatus Nitrosocosmicus sp.]